MDQRPRGSNADELHRFLSEHRDALPYVAAQIAEAVQGLEHHAYIAGHWRCSKCGCDLMDGDAADAGILDTDAKCRNCNIPLQRVTEREEHIKWPGHFWKRLHNQSAQMRPLRIAAGTGK